MTWSKATVITWATIADQIGNETLNEERIDFIANAVTNNKTDGLYVMINETTTKRAWLNQAAAEEYKQFILTDTARLGITIPTVEIIDNVA
jgi:dTDP-4-dehydrorhamnose reductase